MRDLAALLERLRQACALIRLPPPVSAQEVEQALADEQSATAAEEIHARDAVSEVFRRVQESDRIPPHAE